MAYIHIIALLVKYVIPGILNCKKEKILFSGTFNFIHLFIYSMRLILNCKLIFICGIFILLTYTRLLYITYVNDYMNHIANVVLLRAGEISVKCFLCKDQNLSSSPQHPYTN